ncbi:MAG: hypothetical protein KTR28_05520 [Micavibrio sp.]|nr:hypothetical protein [Micavibrio sp.]
MTEDDLKHLHDKPLHAWHAASANHPVQPFEDGTRQDSPDNNKIWDFMSFARLILYNAPSDTLASLVNSTEAHEELKNELEVLDPKLQAALGELFIAEEEPDATSPTNQPIENDEQLESSKEPKKKIFSQLECLSYDSLLALSADGAFQKSPKLEKLMKAYFEHEFESIEEFEQIINDYLKQASPEKVTDLIVLVSRYNNFDDDTKEKLKKSAQKAFDEINAKGRNSERYQFESQLMKKCLPYSLKEHLRFDEKAAPVNNTKPDTTQHKEGIEKEQKSLSTHSSDNLKLQAP